MKTSKYSENVNSFSAQKGDPNKVDPTKQDERDNDPTRIKPMVKEPDKIDPTTPDQPGVPTPPNKPDSGNVKQNK